MFQETLFTSSDSSQIEFTPSYKTAENTPHEYVRVDNANCLELLLFQLGHAQEVCFDTETTSLDTIAAKLVGISFSFHSGEAFYVPIPEDAVAAQKMVENFRGFFEDKNIIKIGQNIKYDILVLKNYKIKVQGPIWDTMLAHYLIEPDLRHGMDYLSETYLSYQPISIETLIGKKGKNQLSMRDAPLDKITEYAAEDADITLQLKHFFCSTNHRKKVEKLFHEVEAPLVYVLADMEATGVKIDADFLNKYSEETGDQLDIIRKGILMSWQVHSSISTHPSSSVKYSLSSCSCLTKARKPRLVNTLLMKRFCQLLWRNTISPKNFLTIVSSPN